MKTLLIYPPNIGFFNHWRKLPKTLDMVPLGIAYIAAYLEKEGLNVNAIDMFDFDFKKVEETIKKEKPHIIGITCQTDGRASAFKVAEIAKSVAKDITVVLGGPHATFLPEQILTYYPEIDFIVLGEGEITFTELVKALQNNYELREVKGIAFRDKDKIIKTPPREPIKDLDSMPFPAYHFFDFKRYPLLNYGGAKKSPMITSRGCPMQCQYCSTTLFWGSNWRARSPKNTVDEIEMLNLVYHKNFIIFQDDALTINQKRTAEICNEVLERGLDIHWTCSTRVNAVTKDLLVLMKKAGCVSIYYGVESGSPVILSNIKKRTTTAQILNAFKLTKEAGIVAGAFMMVGNIGESEETIKETIDFMKKLKPEGEGLDITLATIYPATELYEIAKQRGVIDESYWLTDLTAPVYTGENTLEQLSKWRLKIGINHCLLNGYYKSLLIRLLKYFVVDTLYYKTGIKITSEGISFNEFEWNYLKNRVKLAEENGKKRLKLKMNFTS